jgi:uncharacterized protein (TIGR01244 family)
MRQRIQVFLSVVVTIAVITACGDMTDTPTSGLVEKTDIPGIMNFSRIESSTGFAGSPVGFGGATLPSAMSLLKDEGFATVINLRLSSERGVDVAAARAAAEAAGLNYIHLPFDPKSLTPALVDAFVATLGNGENGPVYVHCGSATRVAALWMIGRVQADGWDSDAAKAEARMIAGNPDSAVTLADQYMTLQKE